MKHITMASRRFAQAKQELKELIDVVCDVREDEGANEFLAELKFVRNYVQSGLIAKLDEAIRSAEWAATEEREQR